MESNGSKLWLGIVAVVLMLLLIPTLIVILAGSPSNNAQAACRPTDTDADGNAVTIPDEYREAVNTAAETAGLPESIIAAQINQESGWDPQATSPVGARGIAQFMPGTWEAYGNGADPFDPIAGIDAMGRYMADLTDQVSSIASNEQDVIRFALAAYNAGPGNVLAAGGIPAFEETQNYVSGILRTAQTNFSPGCKIPGASPINLGPGEWTNPLPGGILTSGYGPRPCPLASCAGMPFLLHHEGIDLAGGESEYFYAPTDMHVTYVGTGPGDPLWTSYGEYIYAVQVEAPHLVFEFHEAAQGSLLVATGDRVKAGTPLGRPGDTGNSSGIHVHFQINAPGTDVTGPTIQNGKSLDPIPFLTEKGVAP